MPPSVLKGIQSLLSGIQSTCWPCGALSHYRRGGYGLNCSGMGALPPFWGSSVSSANSCLGGVRGVSACILGRECLILDQDSSPVPLALEMGKCPVTPWPSPSPAGHIASAKGCGCPVLTASGQSTQPSACPVPPAQPCPGFPRTHSWPPVIAAYLLSCHRCWVCGTSAGTQSMTTFPSSPYATRWSASLQVPACCANVGVGGAPPPHPRPLTP